MELAEIPESDRAQHLDLLLIADESAQNAKSAQSV